MEKNDNDWLEAVLSDLGVRVRAQAGPPPACAARVAPGASSRPVPERVPPFYLPALTVILFALLCSFADLNASVGFIICKIALLLLTAAAAALFLIYPGLMVRFDRRLLAGVRLRPAPAAAADLVFFRLQSLYFLFIAFFIARV